MNSEILTATETIAHLRDELRAIMEQPPLLKEPIITKIFETVTWIRHLNKTLPKVDGVTA